MDAPSFRRQPGLVVIANLDDLATLHVVKSENARRIVSRIRSIFRDTGQIGATGIPSGLLKSEIPLPAKVVGPGNPEPWQSSSFH
jgi:hypothetical protein